MNKDLKIVGIGASARGLEALEIFFSNCPVNSGLSFVVLQHLSPDFKSMHASLLAKKTSIPISVAEDGTVIEPDHIYLIPEAKNIILQNDRLKLVDRPEHEVNFPIDLFFSSLAERQKEKAVGVILSGTGSDGTRGAAEIQEAGGVLFVQNPDESGFDGMPLSVINAGLADFVLNVNQIPKELMLYFNYSDQTAARIAHKHLIDDILEIIKDETNYDFTAYRRQTLIRRIVKRKNINKLDSVSSYKAFLESNEQEQDSLANEFLIGVTRFFRDQEYFKMLEDNAIPQMIAGKRKGEVIKVWSIGCVTGEEAYSLAILLKEALKTNPLDLDFKIFATDISLAAIEKASRGRFGVNIRSDVEENYLSDYFKRDDSGYVVQAHLRKHIVFSNHDILHDPPFNKMDLISCRNLLIYFQHPAQEQTLKNILYALNTNGYLFLGASESLGSFSRYFEVIDRRGKIFRKVTDYDGSKPLRDLFPTRVEKFSSKKLPEFASDLTVQLAKQLALVTDSVCICVNENFHILEVYGSLRLVGSLPFEGFSTNILKLLPKEFHVPVATAIRTLSKSPQESGPISKNTAYKIEDKTFTARLIFDRFDQRTYPHEKFYLIAIKVDDLPGGPPDAAKADIETANTLEIQQLQNLLEDANENLQLTIEELESSNEEAQAANEELVSSNEELQSTNEELQSVNEELYTVNAELQEKNIQLLELNADIENLINSVPIASLFLDDRLHIRRFTPTLRKIINLWESDIGRSITNFSLPDKEFLNDVKAVIEDGKPRRKTIIVDKQKWYLQEIHSYVSVDAVKKGVVINYTDVTDLNEAYREIEKKSKFLNGIVEFFPNYTFIYDLGKKEMIFFNPSFTRLLGYSKEELTRMGDQILTAVIHPDSLEDLRAHYDKLRTTKQDKVFIQQVKMIRAHNKPIRMELADRPFEKNKDGTVRTVLSFLTIVDEKTGTADASQPTGIDLEKLRAEVDKLNKELQGTENSKVRESLQALTDALKNVTGKG